MGTKEHDGHPNEGECFRMGIPFLSWNRKRSNTTAGTSFQATRFRFAETSSVVLFSRGRGAPSCPLCAGHSPAHMNEKPLPRLFQHYCRNTSSSSANSNSACRWAGAAAHRCRRRL